MSEFLKFVIFGLGAGGAYAITGLGIVVIQKGSGILNFAQGATGMLAAFTFKWWVESVGAPPGVAAAATVGLAALLGSLLYVGLFRPVASAPILAKVVLTIGLFGAMQGLAPKVFDTERQTFKLASLLPTENVTVLGAEVSADRIWLVGITIVIGAALWAVFRFSRFGLSTRAASENELGAQLLGYSPNVVGAANWALGSALAGLAGILLLPIVGSEVEALSLVILPALAAALVARFSSFGVTIATGLAIGVGQSLLLRYWSQPGVGDALPFVLIIAAMLAGGRVVVGRGDLTPTRPPFSPPGKIRIVWLVVLPGLALLGLATLDPTYQAGLTVSMIMGIVALSLVLVTGYLGQISLAQTMFAGIGGFAASKFATDLGIPFPWPLPLAMLVALPIGVLIGLPALRVRGINLAVVTLGAAIAVSSVVFQNLDWTGGATGSVVPLPEIAGFSLDPFLHATRFGIFTMVLLSMIALGVANLRRSGSGRRMLAIRSNERAAAAAGINVARTKLTAFALSAAIAALGGALLAYQVGSVTYQQYTPLQAVQMLSLVYIGGIASVSGGLFAGAAVTGGFIYVLVQQFASGLDSWWLAISGILLIVTVLGQPDGLTVWYHQQLKRLLGRREVHRSGEKKDIHGGEVMNAEASRPPETGPKVHFANAPRDKSSQETQRERSGT